MPRTQQQYSRFDGQNTSSTFDSYVYASRWDWMDAKTGRPRTFSGRLTDAKMTEYDLVWTGRDQFLWPTTKAGLYVEPNHSS